MTTRQIFLCSILPTPSQTPYPSSRCNPFSCHHPPFIHYFSLRIYPPSIIRDSNGISIPEFQNFRNFKIYQFEFFNMIWVNFWWLHLTLNQVQFWLKNVSNIRQLCFPYPQAPFLAPTPLTSTLLPLFSIKLCHPPTPPWNARSILHVSIPILSI